jgi:hypothetical protein
MNGRAGVDWGNAAAQARLIYMNQKNHAPRVPRLRRGMRSFHGTSRWCRCAAAETAVCLAQKP